MIHQIDSFWLDAHTDIAIAKRLFGVEEAIDTSGVRRILTAQGWIV